MVELLSKPYLRESVQGKGRVFRIEHLQRWNSHGLIWSLLRLQMMVRKIEGTSISLDAPSRENYLIGTMPSSYVSKQMSLLD